MVSKNDVQRSIRNGRQGMVQNVGKNVEEFLLGKITHNQLMYQVNRQLENMGNSISLEE